MRSNRMIRTLELLKFRVTDPEAGIPESVLGGVITALNEEAVISAAVANKGGINITVTYEAFGAKMHGAPRQEIIFAKQCADNTWENAKNERSHQDPAMAESMLGESSDVSRVLFVPDADVLAKHLSRRPPDLPATAAPSPRAGCVQASPSYLNESFTFAR